MSKLFITLLALGFLLPTICGQTGLSSRSNSKSTSVFNSLNEDEFTDAQIEFFESKVRPILVDHCYECHGPDADPPEGGLSMVSRKAILAGGDSGPGIDLDDLKESNILSAVQYGDLFQMPPDSRLSEDDIQIIRRWVMDKAPWPAESDIDVARADSEFDLAKRKSEHWSWQAISDPAIPKIKTSDWPSDSIDNFILAKLEDAGLSPAKPADRAVWIRRVTFDLTGLPPTATEIENFLNDESNSAFETVVDRLLASPRYGERWARHWMDLVRYAETCGHEFDYELPNAWRYRDYLIRAFNTDVPYNDFLVEHLAGDLIQSPRRNPDNQINESVLGTGFWFLGEATHGPVDVKADEAGRIDNQIDVMGKTFLGLTIACARCHDHKFDAISAEDYYAISGFLQSSRRQNVMLDPHRRIERLHTRATDASQKIAKQVADFIGTLESGENDTANDTTYNSSDFQTYIRGAVQFLKQDAQWKIPRRQVIEGEALVELDKTDGVTRRQDIQNWSGGGQIWWTDAGIDDELELEFLAPMDGQYEVLARFTKARDYGIVKVAINGEPIDQKFDLYNKKVARSKELSLGSFQFDEGPQSILLTITGKNDEAVARYMVGLDYLVLKGTPTAGEKTEVAERLQTICNSLSIQEPHLQNWISAIKDPATSDARHPFYTLRKMAESDFDLDLDQADTFFKDLFNDLQQRDEEFVD